MNIKNLPKKRLKIIYTITVLVIITIISVTTLQIYKSIANKKLLEASSTYQKALISSENSNISHGDKINNFMNIVKTYPNTAFGIFASWEIASLYNYNKSKSKDEKAIKLLLVSTKANLQNSLTNITKTRLARLYIATNQPKKAIEILENLNSLQDNAYPLMLLGQAYGLQRNKTKAIETWQNAILDSNSTPEFQQIIIQLINNLNQL